MNLLESIIRYLAEFKRPAKLVHFTNSSDDWKFHLKSVQQK